MSSKIESRIGPQKTSPKRKFIPTRLLYAWCELCLPQISWAKLNKIINLYLNIYAVEHFTSLVFFYLARPFWLTQ